MYKFDEDKIMKEVQEHIDKTYEGHYNKNKFQATEIGGIDWFNLNDSLDKIRPYNMEKKDVLRKVHKLLLTNNC